MFKSNEQQVPLQPSVNAIFVDLNRLASDLRLMQTHARFPVQTKDVAQRCRRSDASKSGIVHASKTVELRTGLNQPP